MIIPVMGKLKVYWTCPSCSTCNEMFVDAVDALQCNKEQDDWSPKQECIECGTEVKVTCQYGVG